MNFDRLKKFAGYVLLFTVAGAIIFGVLTIINDNDWFGGMPR